MNAYLAYEITSPAIQSKLTLEQVLAASKRGFCAQCDDPTRHKEKCPTAVGNLDTHSYMQQHTCQ